MANHFLAIGFEVLDEDTLVALVASAYESGEYTRVPGGLYVRWAPGAGAEAWVQVVGREWVGVTPHFAGSTSLRAGITARVHLDDDTPLEGYLHAWVNPQEGALDQGEYPFVFAVPDYRALDRMRLPAAARVQLTAFAHELEVHPSEEAYLASQKREFKFAPESFIPSGLFGEDHGPVPLALISGTVLAAERRTNPAGVAFWWMQVRTLGGEVDVVAEEELVTTPPVVGGIVNGEFYLSGRVTLDGPPRRRWWQRIRGG